MRFGMLGTPVGRVVIDRRRRTLSGKRPVVPYIDPNAPGTRLVLGQHRHGRVVGKQPAGCEHVRPYQIVDRIQRKGRRADQIAQRRQAQIDAFMGKTVRQTIERHVHAELLVADHRDQRRSRKAARDPLERRRRLGDLLAVAAGKLLAHRLDHLPLTRHDLERFGYVFTELCQPRAAAAQTCGRTRHHDTLARQIVGEWFARWFPAFIRFDIRYAHGDREVSSLLGGEIVLADIGFQFFELQLYLIEQTRRTFGARAEAVALQLGNRQLHMRDQRLIGGTAGTLGGEFTFSQLQFAFGFHQLGLCCSEHRVKGFKSIGRCV
jgi:hypothetical protein